MPSINESELKKQIKAKEEDLCKKANALSAKRNAAEPSIIETIENYLHGMGMQNAKFIIKHSETGDYTPSGKDDISFMFAANMVIAPCIRMASIPYDSALSYPKTFFSSEFLASILYRSL